MGFVSLECKIAMDENHQCNQGKTYRPGRKHRHQAARPMHWGAPQHLDGGQGLDGVPLRLDEQAGPDPEVCVGAQVAHHV